MKKCSVLCLMLAVMMFSSKAAKAAERGLGLGVVLGEPTGLTGKMWSGDHDAIDAGLSYSFHSYFLAYADRLWHFPGAFQHTDDFSTALSPYVGVGGGLYAGHDVRLNVRVPLGVEWLPATPTLGVFVEVVPALRLVPSVGADIGGGIGIRYYF